jgi:hypothetical protein
MRRTQDPATITSTSGKGELILENIVLKQGDHQLKLQIIMYCLADNDCEAENDQIIVKVYSPKTVYHTQTYTYNNLDRKFIGWVEKSFSFTTDKDDTVKVM